MQQKLYVVTVSNQSAADNFAKSVLKPPFMWGLRRGKSNTGRWESAEVGDVIIFKCRGGTPVAAKILSKKADPHVAEKIWGSCSRDFELLLELSKPYKVALPREELDAVLGNRHAGLQRVSPDRISLACAKFGDAFIRALKLS